MGLAEQEERKPSPQQRLYVASAVTVSNGPTSDRCVPWLPVLVENRWINGLCLFNGEILTRALLCSSYGAISGY